MPSLATQAPTVGGANPAQPRVQTAAGPQGQSAPPSFGIPLPPEMGGQERVAKLESMYGAEAPARKLSLEDDWYEYDQLPIDKIERPSTLESPGGSFTIAKVRWAGEDTEIPDYTSELNV